MSQLDGKVALVTGGGGGIGSAVANLLASRGAKLVVADLFLAAAQSVVKEIRTKGGEAVAIEADLTHEDQIKAMIDCAITTYGRLDVLDNNAADLSTDLGPRDRDIESMQIDVWDRSFRVNTRGTMLACHYALHYMTQQRSGSIINTASNLALQGNVIQAAYSASKAAVLQMTRSIAASHGRFGIRCNAVLPGLTLTPAVLRDIPKVFQDAVFAETLLPQLGEPIDIAYAVAFLASDDARNITGINLVSDAGFSSHVPGFEHLRVATATQIARPD